MKCILLHWNVTEQQDERDYIILLFYFLLGLDCIRSNHQISFSSFQTKTHQAPSNNT